MLAYIHWNASPEIVTLGPLTLRWYGLLFATGFLVGLFLVKKKFDAENIPEAWLDKLFIYMVPFLARGWAMYFFTSGGITASIWTKSLKYGTEGWRAMEGPLVFYWPCGSIPAESLKNHCSGYLTEW